MPACRERVCTFHGHDLADVYVRVGHRRSPQLSAPVKPPSTDFLRSFPNIFAAIRDGCFVCSIQRDGGREAQRPAGDVVHDLRTSGFPCRALLRTARALRALRARQLHSAAVRKRQRLVDEAVKMDGPVLMPFRHKDVGQTVAPDTVVRPTVDHLRQCFHVVPVDFRRVERQRHEIPERRRQADIAHLRCSAAHAALHVGGGVCRR